MVDTYICVDDGYSGARLDRPGLDRLRDGATAGAFEAALVLCPDRLARKYAYQVLILEELERFGVRVVFLEQPPCDDPHARLLTQIQGATAGYERMKIAERYRRGKLFRARQGEVIFWKVPYGYRRIPRRDGVPAHVEVAEAEAQVVREVFAWHVHERLSIRQIALRLTESPQLTATGRKRWGSSTVNRLLRSEAYIGTLYFNRHEAVEGDPTTVARRRRTKSRTRCRPVADWIPLQVPPIVDAELFRGSQAIHPDNSRFSPRHLKSATTSSEARCAAGCVTSGCPATGCGGAMAPSITTTTVRGTTCSGRGRRLGAVRSGICARTNWTASSGPKSAGISSRPPC